MNDFWIQSILTQDQFQTIDRWIYGILKHSGKPDPLIDLDYCVITRKHPIFKHEVIFSPSCFHMLSDIQPEFLSLDTNVVSKPECLDTGKDRPAFVFWFGKIHYFFNIFPPKDLV